MDEVCLLTGSVCVCVHLSLRMSSVRDEVTVFSLRKGNISGVSS